MYFEKNRLKKAGDVALTLLVMLGTLSLAWIGLNGTKSIPTAAKPFETEQITEGAFTVVIDAGHGGFDGGAVGSKTGTAESGLNLEVAKLLSAKLTGAGVRVIMTRNDENALGETKDEDMKARKEIMLDPSAGLVVSIHMNKFSDSTISGPMVFYMRGSDEGRTLAEYVMGGICEKTGRQKRQVNPEDLFVLRTPRVPSVLVECGFLSNPEDEARLLTKEYRESLAEGIADGIAEYRAYKANGDT